MKRSVRAFAVFILLLLFVACSGVGTKATLILTESPWTGWTEEQPEDSVYTFDNVQKGTVIYDYCIFGKITVEKVTDKEILLRFDDSCFVEMNEDGRSYSFEIEPLESLRIKRGEEKKIISQTLDGGVTLTIAYSDKER